MSIRSSLCPCWIAVAVLLVLSSRLQAQPPNEEELSLVYGDKATVSIATGNRQPLRRAPAVATVITAQEIAAMGATDLDEVLEAVPGVHVSRNYQAYNPLYVIRGIYSDFNPQTLVLQNGVPMTTLFVGNRGTLWAGYPVENIARVEVIRGPGSALYGADAYAGVINVITKSAADIAGTELGIRAGSFATRDGWMQYGGQLGAASVAAYLRVGDTEGFRRTVPADAQTSLDGSFGTQASLAPGSTHTGRSVMDASLDLGYGQLRLRADYKLRHDVETGLGAAGALDPIGRGRSERTTIDLSWSDVELVKDWKLGLAASGLKYVQTFPSRLQLFPPGAFGGAFPGGMIGAPQTWERQVRLSAVATYSGLAHHNLRLGVGHDDLDMYRTQEFKNFSITPSGPFAGLPVPNPGAQVIEFPVEESFATPHRRHVNYVYLQDEWAVARDWILTAGLRHDNYSDFGGTTNPRMALVWDASLELTAKLLYGQAFRAPSFTEQYSINNPVIRGNPRLKPETIHTTEAVFDWQARPDLQLNLSLFRYRMRDIIRTISSDGSTAMFDNVGSQHGHGAELEMAWDASRALRLAGSYAYQRSTDAASGRDAGYAPHHHVYARADWTFASGWLFSTQVNRVADRRRAPNDLRPQIDDYTTLDLALRSGAGRDGWTVGMTVRNLFNADVREPSLAPGTTIPDDLPMAPRTLLVSVSYRL